MSHGGFVAVLMVELHFPEAGSLKAKRKELSSIKAQLRTRLGVAVSETDHQDLWQRASVAMAVVSGTEAQARDVLDAVERFVWSFPEIEVVDAQLRWLEVER